MRNILLRLRFDGTAYHGWQVQKNALTVQEALQDALQRVLFQRPDVKGCSRTDAGVHANEFYCNFATGNTIPCSRLMKALNGSLPPDIAVTGCRGVAPDFHARYAARAKEYLYKIDSEEVQDPFLCHYALHYPYRLDLENMRSAARHFCGTHDFSAFCAANGNAKDKVRTVLSCDVSGDGTTAAFRVCANGFLYNMVRIMTGTLLYVSQGKIRAEEIPGILESRDRTLAGPTAPPQGLYLNHVFYDGGNLFDG